MGTPTHAFTTLPLLKREQLRQRRVRWPSSQTQARGSSAIGGKIKNNNHQRKNIYFITASSSIRAYFATMTTDCVENVITCCEWSLRYFLNFTTLHCSTTPVLIAPPVSRVNWQRLMWCILAGFLWNQISSKLEAQDSYVSLCFTNRTPPHPKLNQIKSSINKCSKYIPALWA